jgi:hypothetical protein
VLLARAGEGDGAVVFAGEDGAEAEEGLEVAERVVDVLRRDGGRGGGGDAAGGVDGGAGVEEQQQPGGGEVAEGQLEVVGVLPGGDGAWRADSGDVVLLVVGRGDAVEALVVVAGVRGGAVEADEAVVAGGLVAEADRELVAGEGGRRGGRGWPSSRCRGGQRVGVARIQQEVLREQPGNLLRERVDARESGRRAPARCRGGAALRGSAAAARVPVPGAAR